MRCKACNRPITGYNGKNGDLCSHCRSLINRDLQETECSEIEYENYNITKIPLQKNSDVLSGADAQNIDSRKYFYDFFDNF